MAARGLAIRADVVTPAELRRRAKKEPRRRTAQRMLALANALDGMSRADAARAAGIERQALRDAVLRFNAEGLPGLVDRPCGAGPSG
jgi:transposase